MGFPSFLNNIQFSFFIGSNGQRKSKSPSHLFPLLLRLFPCRIYIISKWLFCSRRTWETDHGKYRYFFFENENSVSACLHLWLTIYLWSLPWLVFLTFVWIYYPELGERYAFSVDNLVSHHQQLVFPRSRRGYNCILILEMIRLTLRIIPYRYWDPFKT